MASIVESYIKANIMVNYRISVDNIGKENKNMTLLPICNKYYKLLAAKLFF